MGDRFVKRFQGTMTKFAEDELNKFLDANPNYRTFYYGIIAYFEKIK